jgi:hypothetical protein
MNFIIENTLLLLFVFSLTLGNVFFGFLGIVLGEYRIKKQKLDTSPRFATIYKEHERKVWKACASDDVSIIAAFIIFALIGVPFFLLIAFGPVGKDEWVESKVTLK